MAGVLDGRVGSLSVTVTRVFDAVTEENDFATSAGNGLFRIAGGQSRPQSRRFGVSCSPVASGADYAAFLNGEGIDIGALNFSGLASLATITVERLPAPVSQSVGRPMLGAALGLLGFGRRQRA